MVKQGKGLTCDQTRERVIMWSSKKESNNMWSSKGKGELTCGQSKRKCWHVKIVGNKYWIKLKLYFLKYYLRVGLPKNDTVYT